MSKKVKAVPEQEYAGKYAAYRKKEEDLKPVDAKRTLFRFFALIKPQSLQMAVVVICALSQTVLNSISPEYTANIINALQAQVENVLQGGKVGFDGIYSDLIRLACIYAGVTIFAFVQEFVAAGVSQKLVCGLRDKVNTKLSRLPLSYFDKQTKGQVISKLINDIDNVSSSLQSSILTILTGVVQVITSFVMLVRCGNVIMTLAAICLVPVAGFVSYKVSRVSKKWFRRYWNSMGDLNGHIEEMYAGHTIVRHFGHQKQSVEEFSEITNRLGHNSFMANIISGILSPVLTLIKNLNYVMLCVLGGYFYLGAYNGTLPARFGGIGDISKFLTYSSNFSSPIVNISKMLNSIQSSLASAERVFGLLDEPEEPADVHDNDSDTLSQGHIEFRDVSFRYVEDRPLIDGLNIDARPGSVTAIVGPTGAGKTTIVNLLMRFYDVNSGTILLDGIDIGTMSRDCLRKNFGMVLQDTWLFKGTIKENIAYGNENATDEQIEEAAKAAQIYDYIMSLPDGFETELAEEGSNLSQGQRQLLTIARAVVADPSVLILDEATSSVDTKTEQKIQTAMNDLMKGRTSFVIAHRLSTIKNADNILVMKKGSIVEQGTHDELLAADGFYALLYNSQYTDGIPPED